jgi:hypothetical protein
MAQGPFLIFDKSALQYLRLATSPSTTVRL